jgi:ferric-dicitrate binding protein FerR (iron transport regulator)
VSVRADTDTGFLNAHAEGELAASEPEQGGTDMETKQVERLVQPTGSIATKHAQVRKTSGKARSVRTTRTTWLGTALTAMVCSVAVMVTSIAPMASGSTSRRAGRTATNNVVNTQLGRLQETGGIAAGTMLGMENFLREFPPTA